VGGVAGERVCVEGETEGWTVIGAGGAGTPVCPLVVVDPKTGRDSKCNKRKASPEELLLHAYAARR